MQLEGEHAVDRIGKDLSRRGLFIVNQRIDQKTGKNVCKESMTTNERILANVAVREMVRRIPQWLRGDLNAIDPMLRERAEDALAAMIAALQEKGGT